MYNLKLSFTRIDFNLSEYSEFSDKPFYPLFIILLENCYEFLKFRQITVAFQVY